MAARDPLPPALRGEPFRVDFALAAGVSAGRLRSSDLATPFHGVRLPADEPVDVTARCRALSTRLDLRHAFSGPTAAVLWGIPLPRVLEIDARVHVSSPPGSRAPRRQGVIGSERVAGQTIGAREGLRVVAPLDCWRDLARILDVPDLIAAGDFLVTGTPESAPLTTLAALRSTAAQATGRGCSSLRLAASGVRCGAWSRPESLLRVALMDAGVDEPQLNPELRLPTRVAHPDLYWGRFKVGVEYHGAYHAEPKQWARDVQRAEDFADAGFDLVPVVAADLFGNTPRTVARIARRLVSRGWSAPRGFDPTKTVRLTP